ncbi:MAG: hypothetical protein ILO53_05835 [Clostridia bacterium]|nr:hypothetical protein [Clostridia bacterium]
MFHDTKQLFHVEQQPPLVSIRNLRFTVYDSLFTIYDSLFMVYDSLFTIYGS